MGSEENNSQCEVPSQRKGGTAGERWIIVPHKNNNTSIRQSVAVAQGYMSFLSFSCPGRTRSAYRVGLLSALRDMRQDNLRLNRWKVKEDWRLDFFDIQAKAEQSRLDTILEYLKVRTHDRLKKPGET